MRPATSLLQLALACSSVTPLASAWPHWFPQIDSLVVRAEDDAPSASNTASASITEAPSSTGKSDDDDDKASETNLNTAKPKTTGTQTGTKTGDDASDATHTEFAPDAPAAGVSMISPAPTAAGTALYKIGDYVTFSWNYTSMLGTPTAIDVLASCSKAHQTWTLTNNMTFETSVEYVWDTSKEADSVESPLLTEEYTLIIKDSEADITDRPEPGYLAAYNRFTFGLYAAQPYTPLSDWTCAGCSGAPGILGHGALQLAVTMSLITLLSFVCFLGGIGLN